VESPSEGFPPQDSTKQDQGTPGGEDEVVLTGSLQQRYPFLRFIQHPDGTLSALVTVPKGYGADLLKLISPYCHCLERKENPAKLEILADAGRAFLAKADKGLAGTEPWASSFVMTPVEDLLIATGTEQDLQEILDSIDLLVNAAPQIEIQAQIWEVTKSDLFERGIVPINSSTPLVVNQGGMGPTGTGGFFRNYGGAFSTATGQNLGGTTGSGGVFQFAYTANQIQIQALIQLLQSTEGVDIISRPRVVVRNGIKADLTSAEQIPILGSQNVSAQGVTSQKIEYKDVGVTLFVIPFLLGGDTVHLDIDAQVNRVGRQVVLTSDNQGNPIFSPTFNKRQAKTVVQVRSGQTVVIGGLKLKESRDVISKIPILGDIPVLNWLFSSRSVEQVDTEVMFLITPIVKSRSATISPFGPLGDVFDPFN